MSVLPGFENWLNVSKKNGKIKHMDIFGKPQPINLQIETSGVHGVVCVYKFMGFVDSFLLMSERHNELYELYLKLNEWQKRLVCEVWALALQKKVNIQHIMCDHKSMKQLGYMEIKN